MDAEKEARRREYLALKAAKQQEIEYIQNLNERARQYANIINRETPRQVLDPDLTRNAEIVQQDPDIYGYKEAKERLRKAKEFEENKEYLKSLNEKQKTPEPDFTKSMGQVTGKVMNQLTDKLSPLAAENEEEGDYTPTNLMRQADAPLRALKVMDNVTGRPVRREIYEMLGGTPKKEVEGSDIRQQLETKTGKLNDIVGVPLELALDFGLDLSNLLPIVGAAGVGRKIATKLATNPQTLEHMASIAAKKAKNLKTLEQGEDLYRAIKERPDVFSSSPGLPKDVTFGENFSHFSTKSNINPHSSDFDEMIRTPITREDILKNLRNE